MNQASADPVIVYLGLGSNLGNRQENLEKALALLSERLQVKKVSPVYETEPVSDIAQPRYLNLACEVQTRLEPMGLLVLLKGIESKMGRVPAPKPNSPRLIDIDILFYGSQVINDAPRLVIPHPRLAERAFVMVPLADIAPDFVHPVIHKTVRELRDGLKEKQGVFQWDANGKGAK